MSRGTLLATGERQPYSELQGGVIHMPGAIQVPRLLVVMGVAGCGKSTIGEQLAQVMGATYLDGDAFHPASNIEKMSRGEALTDEDRWPWLSTFGKEISRVPGQAVGGCSSLRRAYRERITDAAGEPVLFVYLHGSRELIASRMGKRSGHFMPTSLLDSQFATLEVPGEDENAIAVDIDAPAGIIVERIVTAIGEKFDGDPASR